MTGWSIIARVLLSVDAGNTQTHERACNGPAAPAARRPRPVLLLVTGWAFLLGAWALGNPPFAAPDEGAHFFRTAAVAEGTLVGEEVEPMPAMGTDPASLQTAWVAQSTRAVTVPARLVGGDPGCFVVYPTNSAACATDRRARRPASVTGTGTTYVGTYQPLPYLLPALATMPAASAATGDRLARLAVAATALALLALAAALAWDRNAGALSLLGLAVAVTPMVIFSGATLNGSGMEIAAGVAFAAALLRVWRDAGASTLGWTGVGLSGAALALSRSTGPVWVALLLGGWVALVGPRAVRAAVRRSRAATAAGGAILAALIGNRIWEAAYGPSPPLSLRTARPAIAMGIEQLRLSADDLLGQFGYLGWRLPSALLSLGGAALGGLLLAAFAAAGRRERIALVGALAGALLVPFALWIVLMRNTGFSLQGRYVLPVLVAVPLLCGEILVRGRARLTAGVRAALVLGIAGAVAVLHLGAWWYNARQAATGTDGPLLFLGRAEWSPPLGWAPWLVLAVVGAALVAAAIAGPGPRAAHGRSPRAR